MYNKKIENSNVLFYHYIIKMALDVHRNVCIDAVCSTGNLLGVGINVIQSGDVFNFHVEVHYRFPEEKNAYTPDHDDAYDLNEDMTSAFAEIPVHRTGESLVKIFRIDEFNALVSYVMSTINGYGYRICDVTLNECNSSTFDVTVLKRGSIDEILVYDNFVNT